MRSTTGFDDQFLPHPDDDQHRAQVQLASSMEQAALASDFGQAETRMNTGHARQNVTHVGQVDGSEVAAPVSAEPLPDIRYIAKGDMRFIDGQWMTCTDPEIGRWQGSGSPVSAEPVEMDTLFVAGAICRHLDTALDQSKVMAAARTIAHHFAAPVAAQPAPEGWKLVPESIPLAGLDAAIAWMRPAMNEAGRDLAYCLRGVWKILLESVSAPVAAQAQPPAGWEWKLCPAGLSAETFTAAHAQQDGYGYHEGENPPNSLLYQCMAPFHLNLCRGQELRSVIDYGRLVWKQAQQGASKSKQTIIAGPGRVKSFGKITMGEDGWLVFEGFSIDGEGADDPRLAICNAALKEIAKQKDWMLQKSQGCAAIDAARKEVQP